MTEQSIKQFVEYPKKHIKDDEKGEAHFQLSLHLSRTIRLGSNLARTKLNDSIDSSFWFGDLCFANFQ